MDKATARQKFAALSLLLLCALNAQASVNIPFGDFQGIWSAKTTYKAGAVVTYENASYIALAPSLGAAPNVNNLEWAILDAPGATGPQGPPGPKGATGVSGATGPEGPVGKTGTTGATGPEGPVGRTGAIGAIDESGDCSASRRSGSKELPAGPLQGVIFSHKESIMGMFIAPALLKPVPLFGLFS